MAYDRYERDGWRDEPRGSSRDRYPNDRYRDREERGFFERAGDEIASWFGDDDAQRRRHRDEIRDDRDDGRFVPRSSRTYSDWDRGEDRSRRPLGWSGRSRDDDRYRESGWGRGNDWDRDERSRRFGASSPTNRYNDDPHYENWRRQRMDELDRDYGDYRRERQSRFEEDFSNWRNRRQSKRQLLGQIREHMEVAGNDGEHVGTVDRVAGDRIILTKSDPESGGTHHSIPCTMIDKVEDKVILEVDSKRAQEQWRDDSRERALFEREDQGEAGPHILDRSFSGTYR